MPDFKTIELPSMQRLACFGGIYSNYLALESALQRIENLEVDQTLCLGDLGAFGPYPDRVFEPLQRARVVVLQGNYDDSIGNEKSDCQCGYTDPRDNFFAQKSYDYTLANTSAANKKMLRGLPQHARFRLGDLHVLACHGSPRQVNEFLWDSTSSDAFLNRLLDECQADVLLCTHTGIKWHRQLPGDRHVVNVGALGRPENDGTQQVWISTLSANKRELQVDFHAVDYDVERLASEMESEELPKEFIDTIRSGWWTTCLEVLPYRERVRGMH